jgi:Fe-S cluster biogenesis protein NfuA/nitrite reductase/ring-hydroxylating ferredoxin subunit
MGEAQDVRAVGQRVEQLLGELRAGRAGDPATVAEELVGAVVQLYGAALGRIVGVVGEETIDKMLADELVESLLIVHDLHPLDTAARVRQALDKVRPYLGSHAGGVEFLGIDEDAVVHLRLEGTCHGCPSSTVTVRMAIERAIEDAAPETSGLQVEGLAEEPVGPKLLQIGRRPPDPPEPGWVRVPAGSLGPAPHAVDLDGVPVLVLSLDGVCYAYRDSCPTCGASLAGGALDGPALACPSCAAGYDVRRAGAGLDGAGGRLTPLPLLADDAGVRIALGASR